MYGGHYMMWGMHWGWWFLWLLIVGVVLYAVIRFAARGGAEPRNDSPRQILEKRYASGEISSEEYRERKEVLQEKHG